MQESDIPILKLVLLVSIVAFMFCKAMADGYGPGFLWGWAACVAAFVAVSSGVLWHMTADAAVGRARERKSRIDDIR